MSRALPIALVQAAPQSWSRFADDVVRLLTDQPRTKLVVYPELHLQDPEPGAAVRLDGPELAELAELAGDLGVWLAPGSVRERADDGSVFNTAVLLSPRGTVAAWYRKVFPWRPRERERPGTRFVVADLEGFGRVGLSICYDSWFPEHTRHLAWMGAEVVLNVVRTTTCDRAQELVLARANAIVNQVFFVSVNAAGPDGRGESLVVDPEGLVRVAAVGDGPQVLTDVLDLDHVTRTRTFGTAGLNRLWDQFRPDDEPVPLPLYAGRIDPGTWTPRPHPPP